MGARISPSAYSSDFHKKITSLIYPTIKYMKFLFVIVNDQNASIMLPYWLVLSRRIYAENVLENALHNEKVF